jgi:hypothetical protein
MVTTLAGNEDLAKFSVQSWNGRLHKPYCYRYANGVPLREGEDALRVN